MPPERPELTLCAAGAKHQDLCLEFVLIGFPGKVTTPPES
jgi:hypothetical protein